MTKHNHDPSSEYLELVDAVAEFAEASSTEKAARAVADGLEDAFREEFKGAYDVDSTTDGAACIGRLISGWGRCQHTGRRTNEEERHTPHQPPNADHADLWLRDGEPVAFTMHVYDLWTDQLRELVEFADRYGLEVIVEPASWYFANRASHVVFIPPEEYRTVD